MEKSTMNRSALAILLLGVCLSAAGKTLALEPPAAVFDLTAWKLTLPYNTERKGDPDEVVQPELAQFQDDTCFRLSESGDAIIFRASCDGVGTENSKYPRSELREMEADGKDEASWTNMFDLIHELEVELAITHTPDTRPHVVCAQIHDQDDDVLMVRLEGNRLFIERDNAEEVELTADYTLGDPIALRIKASESQIRVWYNDELKMEWRTVRKKCYFKVGCYAQSTREKEGKSGSYGEVEVYQLKLSHAGP